MWDFPHVKTVKADERGRVVLPGIKGGLVFALESPGEGQFLLTQVKKKAVKPHDPYPEGSLSKYVDEWNQEMAPVARKMKVPAPPKEWD